MWHVWPEMYTVKGDQAVANGDVDLAIEFYQRSLTLDPDYLLAYLHLGNIYFRKHQFDLAAVNYQKALALKPQRVEIRIALANTYLAMGDIEKSIQCIETVIESSLEQVPILPKAFSVLASAIQKKGDIAASNHYRTTALMMESISQRRLSN